MTKKGKKGSKLQKGESLYSPKLCVTAHEIIMDIQPLKGNGELHYAKIAKLMGIPSRTFSRWRSPDSEYYKPKFAKALTAAGEELAEAIDDGEIKKGMIARAKPYTRVRKHRELKTRGPRMPAMGGMGKVVLRSIARKFGVIVKQKMTIPVLKMKIAEAVDNQTKEVMVTVSEDVERVHGDVPAAKLVLPNIGPKDKRWMPQEKLEIEGKSLADIAAIMCGKKKE